MREGWKIRRQNKREGTESGGSWRRLLGFFVLFFYCMLIKLLLSQNEYLSIGYSQPLFHEIPSVLGSRTHESKWYGYIAQYGSK